MNAINVQNRQRAVRFELRWLREFAAMAMKACSGHSADQRFALRQLAEVDVAVVSDRTIARVHLDFMNIPGATDVITFEHGEIVMSAQTAQLYAAEHGHSVEQELALYTVHGLLHLNGFEDTTPREAARMHGIQDQILVACLAQLPAPT
ncbi:MAG TPA: rRNA maturation RNase YbeY [Chthoniobacteraceae bacterium]